jgi:biopolymer transport protein ExbB
MTELLLSAAAGTPHTGWLTGQLLQFARGGAEWVLWLLLLLSVGSFFVAFERFLFMRAHAADSASLRALIMERLNRGDVDGLLSALDGKTSMQARVLANGVRDAERGPEAVAELCRGAIGTERIRYERGLSYLATVGSNAPFIGLFGTVMGVIMAFDQLRGLGTAAGAAGPSELVMGAIAEALIATGVGLLVAIPSILFFNVLKGRIKREAVSTQLLVDTMVAYLRSQKPS